MKIFFLMAVFSILVLAGYESLVTKQLRKEQQYLMKIQHTIYEMSSSGLGVSDSLYELLDLHSIAYLDSRALLIGPFYETIDADFCMIFYIEDPLYVESFGVDFIPYVSNPSRLIEFLDRCSPKLRIVDFWKLNYQQV